MLEKDSLYKQISNAQGEIAILIDPEKTNTEKQLNTLLVTLAKSAVHFLFVGGSSATQIQVDFVVRYLKNNCQLHIVLFPGSNKQFSGAADGILYLSLLSSDNPKYLIQQHAENSLEIYQSSLEILPTAYLLIDGNSDSSVAKISNTKPLERTAKKEVLNISLAGLLQGKKLIFLDAGSGAKNTVPNSIIKEIKKHTKAPLIIGGGIKTTKKLITLKKLGVNIMVIGNHLEKNIKNFNVISNYLNCK